MINVDRVDYQPVFVNQRSVERILGVPRRDYLRCARDGAFPSHKERRLIYARVEDVYRVFGPPIPSTLGVGMTRAIARVMLSQWQARP